MTVTGRVAPTRIIATAVFDGQRGHVVIAGQVLAAYVGLEGARVRITVASGSIELITSSMGSFGTAIRAQELAIGETVRVELVGVTTSCVVQ